jgi:hypothetical protein
MLYEALERHYRKPGAAHHGEILIREVPAPGSGRLADLIRIGLWPSRGYALDVHELKVTRADWLRELADPGKADAWWPHCSRFWVVAPAGVVHTNELPPGWGLLQPPTSANRRRFTTVVDAEVKEPQLSLELLATLARRTDNTRLAEMDSLREQHRDELYKARTETRQAEARAGLPARVQERLDLLDAVETALGAKLDHYAWGNGVELKRMAPDELAKALADCGDHIRLQQLKARVEELMGRLSYTAQNVMTEMRKVGGGT